MELKQEYIQRIDSFLERLGYEYIDIRFEMVDHIATDIEHKVSNYDAFFQKNGMRGQFLGYMMRHKKEYENIYQSQSKKQFWSNFRLIFKLIAKELLNIKVNTSIVIMIILFYIAAKQNLFYTSIISVILAISSFAYLSYILNKEVKTYGKLRLVHTFISISSFGFLLLNPIYNFKIITENRSESWIVYLLVFYIFYVVLNVLLTIVFIKNGKLFLKKYHYLLKLN